MSPQPLYRSIVRFLSLLPCILIACSALAADSDKKEFDLEPDVAAVSLKVFAQQSGVEVLIPGDLGQGTRTQAVKGQMTPRQAIDAMLAGTGLVADLDQKNGVFAVKKEPQPDPNAQRVALAKNSDRPESREVKTQNEIVALEKFEVNARNPQTTLAQGVIARDPFGPLPFDVISRDELLRQPAMSAPEALRSLPQNFARGTLEQSDGSNPQGVNDFSANLRGFGTDETLILLNDRRIGGFQSQGGNAMSIPLAAVQRIEVLSGAASAFYGGNAMGGVINYILRSDFIGDEIELYAGNTTKSDAGQYRASFITGKSLLSGRVSFLVAGEASRQNALLNRDRGYAVDLIQRRLSSDPTLFTTTPIPDMPANIRAVSGTLGIPGSTATVTSVPVGYDGMNRGPATYAATAGTYNLTRSYGASSGQAVLQPAINGRKLIAQAIVAITGNLSVFGEVLYSRLNRPRDLNSARSTVNATVPASNPYNPFGVAVQIGFVPLDIPNSFESHDEVTRYVAGFKGSFGQDWRWSLDGTFWRENQFYSRRTGDVAAIISALSSSNPAVAYNPFADLVSQHPNAPQVLAPLVNGGNTGNVTIDQNVFAVRAAGTIWNAPTGNVRISLGAETRLLKHQEVFVFDNPASANLLFNPVHQRANAVYGEIVVPLVQEASRRAWVSSLEFSGALRYEQYQKSIRTLNPLAAVRYDIRPGIGLRGSIGTGTYPPPVSQLIPNPTIVTITPGFVFDPRRNNETVAGTDIGGGNPNLKEEKGLYITGGIVLNGRGSMNGFEMTLDYYELNKTNGILAQNIQTVINNELLLPGKVVRGSPLSTDAPGIPGPITFVDARVANTAKLLTDGVDATLRYKMQIGNLGNITIRANGNFVTKFDRALVVGQPLVNLIGNPNLNGPLRKVGSLGADVARAGWTASITTRYLDGYLPTNSRVEGPRVPSSTEFDLTLALDLQQIPALRTISAAKGLNIIIGAQNLFDRKPPITLTNTYSAYNDPRQRFLFCRLTKAF